MGTLAKYSLVCGLCLAGLGCGGDGPAEVADCNEVSEFADPVLDAVVRTVLGAGASEPLSAEQLATITELSYVVSDTADPIRNLDGIQCLPNLEVVQIEGRYRGDGEVDGIDDASPLRSLASLRELTITYAEFDLAPLGELEQLQFLKLDYAVPGSLESPGSLADLATLVNLTTLDASDGCIGDISTLANMSQLVNLDLYSNCIQDITALADLTNLRDVDLTDNFLDCFESQATLDALRGQGATVVDDC
jgi:hypothetical protein